MQHDGHQRLVSTFLCAALFLGIALAGCVEPPPPLRQVQTRLADKAIFQGQWWMASTTIDVDTDQALVFGTAGALRPWEGQAAYGDLGLDGINLARIRWVIDENTLLAYRAHELVRGGNDEGEEPDFRGQPLAAFRIEAHVDVRQQYSPSTGESTNVTYEDTADRRWYQRQFMRVDWSRNLITSFYPSGPEFAALFHQLRPESVAFEIQEGGAHPEFPDAWKPQFVRVQDDPTYRFFDEWPASERGAVHYMSFVTQEIWSPGSNCGAAETVCATTKVTERHAFLRVPPNHEYASETIDHAEFDRFGIFRQAGRTYTRGGRDRETLRIRCGSDADCGEGGFCRIEEGAASGVCGGGLTSDRGETDFLTFYRSRHNFYKRSFRRDEAGRTIACRGDWECDGRYGDPGVPGSTCDPSAHVCTIPLADRAGQNRAQIRAVTYHLSPHFPAHLTRSAFQVVASWNEIFMRGERAQQGIQLPSGPRIACQSEDPTQYCFCGANASSPEVQGGTCAFRYNPFLPPARARELGVQEPYDCYVRGPEGRAAGLLPHEGDVARPDAFADYSAADAYRYEFVGSECMFVLRANRCDREPGAACEELGDLRYQFFNYFQTGLSSLGGVAFPLADPTSGELITASPNVAAASVEGFGSSFSRALELQRCRDPRADFATCERELSEESVFGGEELRGYFARLGRNEYPVSFAPSAGAGSHGVLRDPIPVDPRPEIDARMTMLNSRLAPLLGPSGGVATRSDRMRALAGTPIEARFVSSLGDRGREAIAQHVAARDDGGGVIPDISPTDPSILDAISPMRDGPLGDLLAEERRQDLLGRMNRCAVREARIYDAGYSRWWAEAFRGRPRDEAALRLSQSIFREIALHEFGHAVGLRHNFAASLDRDQYQDGYYNVVRDLPLPDIGGFDRNRNRVLEGEEALAWRQALVRARDQRSLRGAGNVMASSIMEYPGDLSGASGLGRYDAAAIFWNYFGLTEAFAKDPSVVSCQANSDCGASGLCLSGTCSYSGEAQSIADLRHADRAERLYLRYYRGGESCRADAECPFNASRIGAQPVSQRCLRNPRDVTIPTACGGASSCVCSPIAEDLIDYAAGTPGTPWPRPTAGAPRFVPSNYGFCSDERVEDISWCSRFDAGESFREVVEHYRKTWRERYPSDYFRNYRRSPRLGGSAIDGIVTSAKLFQHFFFRYNYEPDFRSNSGALGVNDQYFASIDAMNWFAELVALPDEGPYRLDAETRTYVPLGARDVAAPGDLRLGVGQAYPTWSRFQSGLEGFTRIERAGVFRDKYAALLALALRDWGLRFTADERYQINFYDLFPAEVTELFGGLIANDARAYGPRVSTSGPAPSVQYTDLFRVNRGCTVGGRSIPCRPPQSVAYPAPAIETSNEVLRTWAAILSLAQFPIYYNPLYERRLSVFREGSGDGWTPPRTREDGSPTCEYGNPDHVAGCERADPSDPAYDFARVDFIRYRSETLHITYVAPLARPDRAEIADEEVDHVGFWILRNARQTQRRITALEAIPSRSADQERDLRRLRAKLTSDESFVGFLIELQRAYGLVQPN